MDWDETCICDFLKTHGAAYVSAAEICRRAGTKKRYRKEPQWALPVLKRLVEKELLEGDITGHYRLKPPKESKKKGRWVSPQIQKILQQSGKDFDVIAPEEDDKDEGTRMKDE